jgi:hypothetical protein
MPGTPTTRLQLQVPIQPDSPALLRETITENAATLDFAAMYFTSTFSTMGNANLYPDGAYLRTTDTNQLFFGDGTSWHHVGSRQYHSWTADASTPFFGPAVVGSFFVDPQIGETLHIAEAIVHAVAVGSPASTFAIQTDHAARGVLASVSGLDALSPGTTQQSFSPSSAVILSSLDRIALTATNAGTSDGVTVCLVTDHFI